MRKKKIEVLSVERVRSARAYRITIFDKRLFSRRMIRKFLHFDTGHVVEELNNDYYEQIEVGKKLQRIVKKAVKEFEGGME